MVGSPTTCRHKTAIGRTTVSRPVSIAQAAGIVAADSTFLDYGCGRGGDLRELGALGITCFGWDPVH